MQYAYKAKTCIHSWNLWEKNNTEVLIQVKNVFNDLKHLTHSISVSNDQYPSMKQVDMVCEDTITIYTIKD